MAEQQGAACGHSSCLGKVKCRFVNPWAILSLITWYHTIVSRISLFLGEAEEFSFYASKLGHPKIGMVSNGQDLWFPVVPWAVARCGTPPNCFGMISMRHRWWEEWVVSKGTGPSPVWTTTLFWKVLQKWLQLYDVSKRFPKHVFGCQCLDVTWLQPETIHTLDGTLVF
jgi:hypothetical protein